MHNALAGCTLKTRTSTLICGVHYVHQGWSCAWCAGGSHHLDDEYRTSLTFFQVDDVMRLTMDMCKHPDVTNRAPCPFTTVHVRLEGDWPGHCRYIHAKHAQAPMRCLIGDDEIAAKLQRHNVMPGSLLHIASGVPIGKLTTLCSQYLCFQSGTLLKTLIASMDVDEVLALQPLVGPSKCLTREVKAVVDFWMATYAQAFFGNFISSFSIELAAEMRYLGKPYVFLNDPCQKGQECT